MFDDLSRAGAALRGSRAAWRTCPAPIQHAASYLLSSTNSDTSCSIQPSSTYKKSSLLFALKGNTGHFNVF